MVREEYNKLYSLPASEVKKFPNSLLAMKILSILAKEEMNPKWISTRLKESEQKIYYHIRQLKKNGLIELSKREKRGGAVAKIYRLKSHAFFMRFREFAPMNRIPKNNPWLEPFIIDGNLNARIVVGSPDPHGIERARARDAYYAIDLALFLGTFLVNSAACVALDTETSNLKENIIIIGGPVINRAARMVNKKMPVRFDNKRNIYSSISKRTYKSDDCGLIVKTKNPFDETKYMLLIAGKRHSGTKAAIMAFLKRFEEIEKKDAHVVEGIDTDSDGIVDNVKIVE